MAEFSVGPLVERAFRAGRDVGVKIGYQKALDDFEAVVDACLEKAVNPNRPIHHTSNVSIEVQADPIKPALPRYQQTALEYLQANPGATSWKAKGDLKNQNVFYKLEKLGLVRKEGSKFYALP